MNSAFDGVINISSEAVNNTDIDEFEHELNKIHEILYDKAQKVLEKEVEELALRINIINAPSGEKESIINGLKIGSIKLGKSTLFIKLLFLMINTELYGVKKLLPEKAWNKYYKDVFKQLFGHFTSQITDVYNLKMTKDKDQES